MIGNHVTMNFSELVLSNLLISSRSPHSLTHQSSQHPDPFRMEGLWLCFVAKTLLWNIEGVIARD